MAGEGEGMRGSRELDQTPTWAVSLVCAVIVIFSLLLEKTIFLVGKAFTNKKKFALLEALEKIKAELMVVGFISLMLTFGRNYIIQICIPEKIGETMLPCELRRRGHHGPNHGHHHHHHELRRMLLWYQHRMLAADDLYGECEKGHVPLISIDGLHQLHIFIFFLAVFHVMSSAIIMTLGRMKIREWKTWENECAIEQSKDGTYLTHETSFVKGHTSSWTTNPVLFYIVLQACFFRHMFWSVRRADYLTLRHGFVSVHLGPANRFDFQKYIKRSLEDDFKVVVGIPPLLWFAAVFYLLMSVKGSLAMFWLSIMPLLIILAVGTKLQSIITRMAVEIQEKHSIVQGIPLVQVSDEHFWLAVNIMCSYITLPLYALVTQMGSHMKRAIFDDQTSKALKTWHKKVRKNKERFKQKKLQEGGEDIAAKDDDDHATSASADVGSTELMTKVDIPGDNPAPTTTHSPQINHQLHLHI
ncbi:hypothetical protein C2S53_003926 [Perilla frutescens var. hirtella]|uniref:MLO-like protein n=1 Tax=Perilla frutescens var. hirtella TaxID=608512 RepID=A0AAD4JIW2_PERFH|nr:hypothetical protein C2S53_003926 [Perilla frutescens var. hirtella]